MVMCLQAPTAASPEEGSARAWREHADRSGEGIGSSSYVASSDRARVGVFRIQPAVEAVLHPFAPRLRPVGARGLEVVTAEASDLPDRIHVAQNAAEVVLVGGEVLGTRWLFRLFCFPKLDGCVSPETLSWFISFLSWFLRGSGAPCAPFPTCGAPFPTCGAPFVSVKGAPCAPFRPFADGRLSRYLTDPARPPFLVLAAVMWPSASSSRSAYCTLR